MGIILNDLNIAQIKRLFIINILLYVILSHHGFDSLPVKLIGKHNNLGLMQCFCMIRSIQTNHVEACIPTTDICILGHMKSEKVSNILILKILYQQFKENLIKGNSGTKKIPIKS